MTAAAGKRGRTREPGRSQDILSAFTRNVARSGYERSNFSEIANELGISKGTIVHHYGTKDRLFAQMHDSYMERRLAEARDIVARFGSPEERLAGLLFAFMLYQDMDRDSTVAFQREAATLASHEALAHGRELRAEYLDLVRATLDEGMRVGVFRELDVDIQSLLIFGSSQWAWTWFRPGERLSAVETGGQLVQLGLGALLVDRLRLNRLADPEGQIAGAVLAILGKHTASRKDNRSGNGSVTAENQPVI